MDCQRFDRIVRGIAQKGTRRSLVAGLGTLAGIAALKPFGAAAACQTCKGNSRSCGRANRCFDCSSDRTLYCNRSEGGAPQCCSGSGNCTSARVSSCPS